MNALEQLTKWDRKYYRFKIESYGHIMGDGVTVELYGGGRKVCVNDSDLANYENGQYPTLDETIKEAIHRWHADASIKNYRVIFYTKPDTPDFVEVSNVKAFVVFKHGYGGMVETQLSAKNEAEAVEIAKTIFPGLELQSFVWELDKDWRH